MSAFDEGSSTRVEAQKVEVKGSRDGEKEKTTICVDLRKKA